MGYYRLGVGVPILPSTKWVTEITYIHIHIHIHIQVTIFTAL
jgi:hypothetical protein